MPQADTTYFFRNGDEAPVGPVHLSTLKHRAALGEVDGATAVATSAEGPWTPALRLHDLELDWRIEDEAGHALPECHVLALRAKVDSGEVQPFWEAVHIPTGEDYQVVDALCSALLEQNRLLESRLRSMEAPSPAPTDDVNDDADPRELRLRRDEAVHEAEKWKRLYDDEIRRNRAREEELLERTEELRAWQRKAAERIKSLERRRGQLEELMKKAPSSAAGEEDRDLSRAYQELQLQLEHLIDSLHLRARELEEAREENRELRLQYAQTRSALEESLEANRELHADTLEQLSKLEQAHTDLIREYRELNHRVIQLRNARDTPAPSPSDAPEAPAPSAPPLQTRHVLSIRRPWTRSSTISTTPPLHSHPRIWFSASISCTDSFGGCSEGFPPNSRAFSAPPPLCFWRGNTMPPSANSSAPTPEWKAKPAPICWPTCCWC